MRPYGENQHSPYNKLNGSDNGIRTRVFNVKGWCPEPTRRYRHILDRVFIDRWLFQFVYDDWIIDGTRTHTWRFRRMNTCCYYLKVVQQRRFELRRYAWQAHMLPLHHCCWKNGSHPWNRTKLVSRKAYGLTVRPHTLRVDGNKWILSEISNSKLVASVL